MMPDDVQRELADDFSRAERRYANPAGGIMTRDEYAAVEWGVASGRRMVLRALERYDDGAIETGHGESVPLDPSPAIAERCENAPTIAERCENAPTIAQDRLCATIEAIWIVITALGIAALLPLLATSAAVGWIVAWLGRTETTE